MYICKNVIHVHQEYSDITKKYEITELTNDNYCFPDEYIQALGINEGYIDCFYKKYLEYYKKYQEIKRLKDEGRTYDKSEFREYATAMGCACSDIVFLYTVARHQYEEKEPDKHIWMTIRPDIWAAPELQKYILKEEN